MIRKTDDLSPSARDGFDAIIDVRSPAEFAADHIPGAINLPVLDDAERAEVGTLYNQQSHFAARHRGAALVAANIARHLQGALADRPATFRPLLYCWRGGMRSGAMATVFDSIGWQTMVVEGGYRNWRRQVVASLYDAAPLQQPLGLSLWLLAGPTGSGKTAILSELAAMGHQMLDLEAMARHRGSLFGAMPGGQPPQKLFESRLFDWLQRADWQQPVFAEAESSRVGDITLPPALWASMIRAPRIELAAGPETRVRHILAHYGWIAADPQALGDAIRQLPSHHSAERRGRWLDWAKAGDLEALVRELIEYHYDPAYAASCRQRHGDYIGRVAVGTDLPAAARAIAGLIKAPQPSA